MSTPRELESIASYKICKIMSERIDYRKSNDRFATPQKMTQLMLVAENKITYDKDNKPQWNNNGKDRKFTPSLAMIKSGGWNQEGLDQYHELLEREKLKRKELKEQYKNNPQGEEIESDGEKEEKWLVEAVLFVKGLDGYICT
eukprot:15244325-Ditylum_brightwellii.AAC.1